MTEPNNEDDNSAVTPYTPEEQEVIGGLIEAQKHLGLSDDKFAKEYIKTYTTPTWNRLRRGVYKAADRSKVIAEMRSVLAGVRRRIARREKTTQGSKYYELSIFAAMFQAVEECLVKKGENRLVIYVAETGEGKSRFIAELGLKQEVVAVRANEAWFGSYFYAALDMLEEQGITGTFRSASEARRALLCSMKEQRAKVLAVDEGNYFGPRSINLVKDILNETDWTVFVAMTPAFWAKMQRHYAEWIQLQRRIHTVFKHKALAAKDAQLFLADAGLNGDARSSAVLLVEAANKFGGYDFVMRVIERLRDKTSEGAHPTIDDVRAAIISVKANLGLAE